MFVLNFGQALAEKIHKENNINDSECRHPIAWELIYKGLTYFSYGDEMQKEEIIQLHTLFAKIKDEMEKQHPEKKDAFKEYEEFGVLPQDIHKSRYEHKRAAFILMEGISKSLQ